MSSKKNFAPVKNKESKFKCETWASITLPIFSTQKLHTKIFCSAFWKRTVDNLTDLCDFSFGSMVLVLLPLINRESTVEIAVKDDPIVKKQNFLQNHRLVATQLTTRQMTKHFDMFVRGA